MQDLGAGSVTRHLLKTAGFMLVAMAAQTLYFLVDLYWVGRLGPQAVAAVAISGNLMFLVLAMSQVLAVGTTTLVSHAAGQKDRDRAQVVFDQSQRLSLLVGALFLGVAMALRPLYVRALSADTATALLASDYLRWFIPASALQFAMVAMSAALRGAGSFRPGMVAHTASLAINMILAPFLIFGWGTGRPLGVAGAGLSTLVAVVVGMAWLARYFLLKDAYLRIPPSDWTTRLDLWGAMLRIGLPAGAEFAVMAIYLAVVFAVIQPFGAAAQAGFGIGMRVLQAGFMPVVALGFAVASVAGQNFGARKPDRVRETFRSAACLSVGAMIVFAIICHIDPAAMVAVFSSDPQVVGVGDVFLRIVSWNSVPMAIIFVASSMFQAMGNTVPALASSFVRILIVVPAAVLLSRLAGFELRWVWYLSVAAAAAQMALSLLLLRREFGLRLGAPADSRVNMRTEGAT